MSVRYEQQGGRLLIEMWDPGRLMPRWLVFTLATITLGVLMALWAGFLYLKPWEAATFGERYHARGSLKYLVALSVLLVVTVRGELIGNRERLMLEGSSMVHTRLGRIGVRLDKRYDLRQVTGLIVEPTRISFDYAGKRHSLGYLLDAPERIAVADRILGHWNDARRRHERDHAGDIPGSSRQ